MGFLDLLFKKNYLTNRDQVITRLKICQNCPYLLKQTNSCLVCGCFVEYKAKLKTEDCPKHNWPKLT